MSTPNRPKQPKCTVDGRKMYYDITDVTEGKVVKGAFEAKFLIDTVEAIKGQCFTVHQHCKGLYPEVKGPEAGRNWLTSVDQDNDISLQQTLDKSDIPILYNTPRFCDPGITKSRNWSLKNYIQTRLYLYKRYLTHKNSAIIRNSSKCYSSVVFDFRPFAFSMKLPVEKNSVSGENTDDRELYFLQWMEIESGSEYGYKANTAIYDNVQQRNAQIKNRNSSVNFFKQLVMNYSKKGMTKKSAANIQKTDITITNNQLDGFMQFLVDYDGIKFGGSSGTLNVNQELKPITLTDDILRMFYFDLMHDLGKGSPKFKKLRFIEFKQDFMSEFRKLKGVHRLRGLAGAGTTATSYQTHETLIQKRNVGNTEEIPAIFKTVGDLSQYLYAAKYGTSVGSGDRMGIAVGLYVCAKIGIPVKTMIEDGITGFILYTGRENVKLSGGSSCKKNNNAVNACSRNAKIAKSGNIITETLNSTPRIAAGIAAVEARKPKLPPNMKSLMSLWTNSASVINATGVEEIIKTIKAFDGYWSKDDLNKFLNIVQTLQKRNNIKPNSELSYKLNVLRGEFRGKLPNNGSPSRSGFKRTRSNGKNPTTLVNNSRQPTPPAPSTNNAANRRSNGNGNNAANRRSNGNGNKPTTLSNNSRQPTPPAPSTNNAANRRSNGNGNKPTTLVNNSRQPTPPAPSTNNAANRRANLSAYINNLQTRLLNKNKINYNFKKNTWMKNLSNNNTNSRLKIIKEQLNGIYKIQQGQRKKNNFNPRSLSG